MKTYPNDEIDSPKDKHHSEPHNEEDHEGKTFSSRHFPRGLTKREYLAAKAMQGLLASPRNGSYSAISKGAIIVADFLIKELNKSNSG